MTVNDGIIHLTVGRHNGVFTLPTIIAHSVLKAIEAQFRTSAVDSVGLAGLHIELIGSVVLLLHLDTIKVSEGGTILSHKESLVGIEHHGHDHLTILGRLQAVLRATFFLTIHTVTLGVVSVALHMRISRGGLIVILAFHANSQRDVGHGGVV